MVEGEHIFSSASLTSLSSQGAAADLGRARDFRGWVDSDGVVGGRPAILLLLFCTSSWSLDSGESSAMQERVVVPAWKAY